MRGLGERAGPWRPGLRRLRPIGAVLLLAAAAWPWPGRTEPPTLSELVEVVDLSSLSASPDGRLVAVRSDRPSIERNGFELGWHIVDAATGSSRPIGPAGEAILVDPGMLVDEPPIWSPDGRWIYFRALRAGSVQVWRSAADGSASHAVTAEEGDVVSLDRSADGRGLVYRVGPPRSEIERAELEEYDSGILVDEHVELGQNVFRGAIVNGRHSTQRLTGNWFRRGGLLWSQPPRLRKLDFGTLASSDAGERDFPSGSEGEAPESTARSSGGDVATSLWNGSQGSLVVERGGGRGTRLHCPIPECRTERVAWAAWRPGRDQLVFATADRAIAMTVRLWDLASGRVRILARSNGLLNGGREESRPCAIAASSAYCVAAEPNSPPRLEAIDLETGLRRPSLDPNGALRARTWPPAERLAWRSPDGRQFTGVLFLPERASRRPLPLFVNYYRCEGFVRGGLGDEWPFALLAASGIASVCVNATRMGGPQDGVGQYRPALAGIEALVEMLAGRGIADRARVGMGGLSFGSEVTMWAVAHSDLVSAASIASPQFAPSTYWFNSVRGRDYPDLLRRVWGLGSPNETPEQWRLLSPALHVERIRAPLLMQLSEQESRYGIELYAQLSNSPVPTELYVFPDEPHIKVQPRHRLAVYRRNLDWFRFWLQGHEDPDPARAGQYRRWRALAERFQGADQRRRERSQSSSETRSNTRK